MRILIVTDHLPYPPVSGDRLRVYSLLRRIAALHEVTLAAPQRPDDDPDAVCRLGQICHAVLTGWLPRRSPMQHLPGVARYALAGRPPELLFQDSPELRDLIARAAFQKRFDVVHIEPSRVAPYAEAAREFASAARVLVFHNIAAEQLAGMWRLEGTALDRARGWLNSQWMGYWEPRYAGRFHRSVTVSDRDRDLLLAANPRLKVDVVPNGVDTESLRPLPENLESPALLYVGTMDYAPNADAARLLVERVLPLVRHSIPEAKAYVVGSNPPEELTGRQFDGVVVTGRVSDVVPYYRSSTVSVVPLRAGGGTRLKILESMALGRPVVSTRIGCEGLAVRHGEHLLVADTPEEMAARTISLLTDPALRRRIVDRARELVVNWYDWDTIARGMMVVYESAIEARNAERSS